MLPEVKGWTLIFDGLLHYFILHMSSQGFNFPNLYVSVCDDTC